MDVFLGHAMFPTLAFHPHTNALVGFVYLHRLAEETIRIFRGARERSSVFPSRTVLPIVRETLAKLRDSPRWRYRAIHLISSNSTLLTELCRTASPT